MFTHVGSSRAAGSGTKRRGATGGGPTDGSTDASVAAAGVVPAKRLRTRAERRQRIAGAAVAVPAAAAAAVAPAAAVAAAVAAAAAAGRLARGLPHVPRGPKLTNRGTGLAPLWGRGRGDRRAYGSGSVRCTDCTSRVGVR